MQVNLWVTNAMLKQEFQDLKTWLKFYQPMGEQHSCWESLFNSHPKLGWIYFDLEDKIGRLDSSVADGVALRPGDGESQGSGAGRAPARQVALGQEVDG